MRRSGFGGFIGSLSSIELSQLCRYDIIVSLSNDNINAVDTISNNTVDARRGTTKVLCFSR